MSNPDIINEEINLERLKGLVNKKLKEMGSSSVYNKISQLLPETEAREALRDKKILYVDDLLNLLEIFLPALIVASDGHADILQYTGQSIEELTKQILNINPDILLLDYHLSETLKGHSVSHYLREQNFNGNIIGFSSDTNTSYQFEEAGANGSIDKDTSHRKETVEQIAKLIKK
ncbi:MAG: hypothetical protein Q8O88_02130 [bacterium]|nr:hypothetical protein [bacterium]